ncbi:hypothetical protein CLCR_08102 [Cladophialophora carrionii]|uniref:Uncharacterized protein n=1 Tax=Cladophialophora carrionii TaxID=86049 RepID=A0A1C1CUG5_9EURO|nr:hypothetical protein CLCR_08102 [Cladophialophora carrionii]
MPFCFLLMVNVLFSLLGLSMVMGLVCLGIALAVLVCGIYAVAYAMVPATRLAGRMGAQVVNYVREGVEGARKCWEEEEAAARRQKDDHTSTSLARRTPQTPDQPIAQPNHFSVPYSNNTSVLTGPSPYSCSGPTITTRIISVDHFRRLVHLESEHSTIFHKLHNVPGSSVLLKIESLLRELQNPSRLIGSRRPDECDKCNSKDTDTKAKALESALAEKQQLQTKVQELESRLRSQNETHDSAEKQQLKTKVQELESKLRSQNETHDSVEKQHLQARVQELKSNLRSQHEKHEEEVKNLRLEAQANAKLVETKTQELEQVQACLSQTQQDPSNETAITSQLQESVKQQLAGAAEKEVAIRAEYQAHIDLLMTAGREIEANAEASRGQHQAEVERLTAGGRQVEAEAENLRGMLQTEKSAHAASKVQLDAVRTQLAQATQALLAERQSARLNDGAMAVDEPGHLPCNPSGLAPSSATGFNPPASTVPTSTSAPATSCGDLEALRELRAAASNWHNQQQRARAGAMQSSAQPPVQTATSRATQPAAYVTSDGISSHANLASIVAEESTAPAGSQCSEVPSLHIAVYTAAPTPTATTATLPQYLPSPRSLIPTRPIYTRSTSHPATPAHYDGSERDPLRRQMMAVVMKAPPPQGESDSDSEADFEDVNLEPAALGDNGMKAAVVNQPVEDGLGTQHVMGAREWIELKGRGSSKTLELEARRKVDEIEDQKWKEEQAQLQREREQRGEILEV